MPLAKRFTALACMHCTIKKIRCHPLAKWANELALEPLLLKEKAPAKEKAASKQSKGKGKKWNAAGLYSLK